MRLVIYAVIIIAGLSGIALAQNNTDKSPANANTKQGSAGQQAPVSHRQPKQKDLPADVLQRQQTRPSGDKEYDKSLTICKGC